MEIEKLHCHYEILGKWLSLCRNLSHRKFPKNNFGLMLFWVSTEMENFQLMTSQTLAWSMFFWVLTGMENLCWPLSNYSVPVRATWWNFHYLIFYAIWIRHWKWFQNFIEGCCVHILVNQMATLSDFPSCLVQDSHCRGQFFAVQENRYLSMIRNWISLSDW